MSFSRSSAMFDDLRSDVFLFEIRHRACDIVFLACKHGDHAAELFALEDFDVGKHDIEIHVESAGDIGDDGIADDGVFKNKLHEKSTVLGLDKRRILANEAVDLFERGSGSDEFFRDILLRICEDIVDLAFLHDLTVFHDGDLVADRLDDRHFVRDEHDGDAELFV